MLTREVVALETSPSAPSWGDLAPLLARAEWRGELRRGYFVEGLSGVQYASEEAASELARLAAAPPERAPIEVIDDPGESGRGKHASAAATLPRHTLVCSADPANIYGAGAPLDIELLDGGVARLPRLPGNFLVVRDGRPILIIESYGKRLTGLPWASAVELNWALALLPNLAGPNHRIFKIETYNGGPAAESPAVPVRLTEVGFVRDYTGLTFYAGWPQASVGS